MIVFDVNLPLRDNDDNGDEDEDDSHAELVCEQNEIKRPAIL